MFTKSIIVNITNGLHTRVAAMVVNKASELKNKYGSELYIKRKNDSNFLAISMLALVSLKIQKGEAITVGCNGNEENSIKAINSICKFIELELTLFNSSMNKIDAIIEENIIANDQIIENLPIGIVVIDTNSSITTINNYALKILNKSYDEVVGKNVRDIIPTTDLPNVISSKLKQFGQIQDINGHTLMTNRSPIMNEDNVIGAIGVFQDVSEIVGMQELNERLKRILETSHDSICFVNEKRIITYINPSYEKTFSVNMLSLVGKDLNDISPNGLRMKVFNSKEKLENVICQKEGIDIISNIDPLFIDGEFKGVISSSKAVSEIKHLLSKLEKSEEELKYYKEELLRQNKQYESFKEIIGTNSALKDVLNMCKKSSKTTSNVLIRGESGTGKELIAKAIHFNSDRRDKPFVRVNCAAIPENLLESELFGYEKGAFTGAIKNKPGKFALANGGTIFLDEIGDMPIHMQVKLLRVIQEKEVEPVGGIAPFKVDVRIIAATHRDLESMIDEKTFRADLYYRLNVLSITLPPLRERKDDIGHLTNHFILKLSQELNKYVSGINNAALSMLEAYHWPGNIRELQNVIERAINLCEGSIISCDDLPYYIQNASSTEDKLINSVNGEVLPFEAYEKQIIELAMKTHGSFNKAGKALGLTHRTVSLKCKKYGIDYLNDK